MKTKTMLIWGIGGAAAVGLGLAMMGTARAEDDPEGSKDDDNDGDTTSAVRHGIRHEGCDHFELVDPDAIEAWARDNAWRFSKWLLRLDELRQDPEPGIVDALSVLFPECTWPPPSTTTFEAQRYSWDEAMAQARAAAASMDLAPAPGTSATATTGAFIGHMTSLALGGGHTGGRRR